MNANQTLPNEKNTVFSRLAARWSARRAERAYHGDDLVCPPEERTMSPLMRWIGIGLRMLIIYIGVLGMMLFLADAIGIFPPLWMSLLASALSVLTFGAILLGGKFRIGGWIALGVEGLYFLLFTGNPITILTGSVSAFWNQLLVSLDPKVFASIYLPVLYPEGAHGNYIFYGLCMLCALLALIFTASALRRVRMIPLVFTGLLVVLPITTYNITSSNWGFALILTALFGLIVMRLYDGIFNRKKVSAKHASSATGSMTASAGGGFAGFAAAAMAFLLLLGPAATMTRSFQNIPFIYDRMVFARTIITAIITGNELENGYLKPVENDRTTGAEPPQYFGRTMMQLNTSFKMPIYLRSWTATNYENNSWYSVTSDEAKAYTKKFGDDFNPDSITRSFYDLWDPTLLRANDLGYHYDHTDRGFMTETVDIGIKYSTNNLLFTTPHIDTARMLMNRYSKTGEAYSQSYKQYFEGTMIAGILNFSRNYRVIAYVPTYIKPSFARNFWQMQQYYTIMYEYIGPCGVNNVIPRAETCERQIAEARERLDALGFDYPKPTILETYYAASEQERAEIYNRYFADYARYTPYVEEHYTALPEDSKYLMPIATEIRHATAFDECMQIGNYHGAILEVLRYLGENYTFTLTPTPSADPSLSALDSFLHETKEGHYVQFSTAATMILRALGFPARYCEGYLVTEFEYDSSANRKSAYSKTIYDSDAHAWVEVYLPGIGWMPYETLADNFAYFYAEESEEIFGMNHDPEDGDEGEEKGDVDISDWEAMQQIKREEFEEELRRRAELLQKQKEEEEKKNTEFVPVDRPEVRALIWGIAALIVFAVYAAVFPLPTRSRRAAQRRLKNTERVLSGNWEESETKPLADYFCRAVWSMHAAAGCAPKHGELPDEYTQRVDTSLNASGHSFEDVFSYMNREEFGSGMRDWQLRETVEYYNENREKLVARMSPWRRFWHFKVLCDL